LGGAGWALAQSVEKGTSWVSASGTRLRLLVDQSNLGGEEVELGEITFAANGDSGDHAHGSTEIFYVLEGELEHIVNGKSYRLKPGMVGYVRPPDQVRHKVGPGGAKALVIWAPGGEGSRITAGRWKREP
jgi:quercetin dioxygenase-like cupin family protein